MAPNPTYTAASGDDDTSHTHTTHMIDIPCRSAFVPREAPKERPRITPIPRIDRAADSSRPSPSSSSPAQPLPPPSRYQRLAGRFVDEFGNILDDDGTVLGRAEGDLPSMVGRPVSDSGDVLDVDGDVVGRVVEDLTALPELQELDGALRVDANGNIYDAKGQAIGKLNEPPKQPGPGQDQQSQQQQQPSAGGSDPGRYQQQAPASAPAPRPASAPNPSEIYLDVKSTYEGIQIILKIPTIFNRDEADAQEEQRISQEKRAKEDRHQQRRASGEERVTEEGQGEGAPSTTQ